MCWPPPQPRSACMQLGADVRFGPEKRPRASMRVHQAPTSFFWPLWSGQVGGTGPTQRSKRKCEARARRPRKINKSTTSRSQPQQKRHSTMRPCGEPIGVDSRSSIARSSPVAIPTGWIGRVWRVGWVRRVRRVRRVVISMFKDVFVGRDMLVYVDIDITRSFMPAERACVAGPLFLTAA